MTLGHRKAILKLATVQPIVHRLISTKNQVFVRFFSEFFILVNWHDLIWCRSTHDKFQPSLTKFVIFSQKASHIALIANQYTDTRQIVNSLLLGWDKMTIMEAAIYRSPFPSYCRITIVLKESSQCMTESSWWLRNHYDALLEHFPCNLNVACSIPPKSCLSCSPNKGT